MSIFNKMFRKASPDCNTSAGPEKRAREPESERTPCEQAHLGHNVKEA